MPKLDEAITLEAQGLHEGEKNGNFWLCVKDNAEIGTPEVVDTSVFSEKRGLNIHTYIWIMPKLARRNWHFSDGSFGAISFIHFFFSSFFGERSD